MSNCCNTLVPFKVHLMDGCEDLVPRKAHKDDAGFDLYAAESFNILPGRTIAVPVGFCCELPVGYELQIRSRSGLALNKSVVVANSPGTVDCNYRGTVAVLLKNESDTLFTVNRGDRIAQGVVCKLPAVELVIVDNLSDTDRGSNGFGSTGTN